MNYKDYVNIKTPKVTETDVDPKELSIGTKEEFEHTNDEELAKIIALHHLAEDPHYYTKLKSLNLEEISNNQYKIFLDMDGVLTDFDKRFKDSNEEGLTMDEYSMKYSKTKAWKLTKDLSWWEDMEWTEDGPYLWEYLSSLNVPVEILSSPSLDFNSKKGKMNWVARELGNDVKVNLIVGGKNKVKYAKSKYDILIDDTLKNINSWNTIGTGIHHTSFLDTKSKLKNILNI